MVDTKMKHYKYYLLIIIIAILFGCSQTSTVQKDISENSPKDETTYEPGINLFVKKVYSWVNLMPSMEPRFHITGNVVIPESEDYDFQTITISMLKIYQDGSAIYYINPTVQVNEENQSHNVKELLYSTITGLLIDARLNFDKTIDVEYIFEEEGESFSFIQRNVKINKVY